LRRRWNILPPSPKKLSIFHAHEGVAIKIIEHLSSLKNSGALPYLQEVHMYLNITDPRIKDDSPYFTSHESPADLARFDHLIDTIMQAQLAKPSLKISLTSSDIKMVSAQFHPLLMQKQHTRQIIWLSDLSTPEARGLFEHLRLGAQRMWREKRKALMGRTEQPDTSSEEVVYENHETTSSPGMETLKLITVAIGDCRVDVLIQLH
jgi:hypothetical protein